jgi:hypothetical protein
MLLLVTYMYIHAYIYTHICISLVHHTVLMATGRETSRLTTYMTNIQAIFNIIQFNHNYVHIKIKFKIAKLISKIYDINLFFFQSSSVLILHQLPKIFVNRFIS